MLLDTDRMSSPFNRGVSPDGATPQLYMTIYDNMTITVPTVGFSVNMESDLISQKTTAIVRLRMDLNSTAANSSSIPVDFYLRIPGWTTSQASLVVNASGSVSTTCDGSSSALEPGTLCCVGRNFSSGEIPYRCIQCKSSACKEVYQMSEIEQGIC